MADMNISIGQDLIKPIIEAKIQTAIFEAMGKSPQMIETAVTAMLMQKVDSQGRPSNSSYDTRPFLNLLCDQEIREAAKKALIDHLETSRPLIMTALKKAITKNTEHIAVSLVNSLIETTKHSYRFHLSITQPKGD